MADGKNNILDNSWFFTGESLLVVGLTDRILEEYRHKLDKSPHSSALINNTFIDADLVKTTYAFDRIDGSKNPWHTTNIIRTTIQEFLDSNTLTFDHIILDGIFDKWRYDTKQYDFFFKIMEVCFSIANKSVRARIDLDRWAAPYMDKWATQYNIIYLMTNFINNYSHVSIEKVSDTIYIFTLNKD